MFRMVVAARLTAGATAILGFAFAAEPLGAQSVNISGLSDVSLTGLRPLEDARRAQPICVFSDTPGRTYLVTAQGSGQGGSFVLDGNGTGDLPFSVEWSDSPAVTSGMPLSPGQPLGGQASSALDATCSTGPTRSASLIVVITRADLTSARSGVNYRGTLTLTVAPQ